MRIKAFLVTLVVAGITATTATAATPNPITEYGAKPSPITEYGNFKFKPNPITEYRFGKHRMF